MAAATTDATTSLDRSRRRGWLLRPPQIENLLCALAAFVMTALLFTAPSITESLDYVLFYKPNFHFLVDAIKHGHLPLWNPYIGLGRPYLADMQNAVFYPPTYFLLLGSSAGLFLLLAFHNLVAVLGVRELGRALGMGKPEQYWTAFAYAMSGAMAGRLFAGHILYEGAASYLPWLLLLATRLERWNGRVMACYAGVMALQFLCGHPQVWWLSIVGQVLFIAGRNLERPLAKSLQSVFQVLLRFSIVIVWCGLIVAVQLLPFLELVQQSNRTTPSPEFVNFGSLDWLNLSVLFAQTPTPLVTNWEYNLFIGMGLFVPGVAGLALAKDRNVRGLMAMLLGGLIIAVGNRTPLFELMYDLLPGFTSFRLHARGGLLIVLALLLSGGIWVARMREKPSGQFVVAGIGVILFWFIAAYYPYRTPAGDTIGFVPLAARCLVVLSCAWLMTQALKPGWRCWALTVLVITSAVELILTAQFYKKRYTYENLYDHSVEFPRGRELLSLLDRLQKNEGGAPPRVLIPADVLPTNEAMIHGYSHCDAYTSLFLQRPWACLHDIGGLPEPAEKNSFLSPEIYSAPLDRFRHIGLRVGTDATNKSLIVNSAPDARARLVYGASSPLSAVEVRALVANGHDHQTALLEDALPLQVPAITERPAKPVAIRHYEASSLEVEVNAEANAILVLAEAWYPGWRAEIGKNQYEAIPANGWMRAFPVPAGKHTVRVYFRQNYLLAGAASTMAGLVLVLMFAWPRTRHPGSLAHHVP